MNQLKLNEEELKELEVRINLSKMIGPNVIPMTIYHIFGRIKSLAKNHHFDLSRDKMQEISRKVHDIQLENFKEYCKK